MNKLIVLFFLFFGLAELRGQSVEVQANYNSVGDVDFIAYNNTSAPVYLNIDFADLENTVFHEPLPYIKFLEPGFNTLFTLFREPDAEVPRFNYQLKVFRSDPMSLTDLNFPYLIPFSEGLEVLVKEVKNLDGFWGSIAPGSWNATGFVTKSGEAVFASRSGIVVEVVGAKRTGDPQNWYHTWNHSVTLLHPDGTLICYRNVFDNGEKLRVGEKIFAGQQIGEVTKGADELIILIYQQKLNSSDLRFIIPQFVTSEDEVSLLLSSKKYTVIHPKDIKGLEMNSREKRRFLR
ncbi:MAG: hypothetical protein WCY58_03970 [Mariniphaga sp.]|nr:hypothetical protein [Mariniphaga sp.]MDD4226726.1 hypothetical protein [Mariniphaga sp.]